MDDLREIEELKNTNFRDYSFKTFKKYGIDRRTIGKSKRARVLKSSYIVVYSLWHKKLLARTFYIEEYFEKKQLKEICIEVNRQLAGNKYKLHNRLYNSGCGAGFRVWREEDKRGWQISSHNTYHVWGMYNPWTSEDITYHYLYNNPLKYLQKSVHKYSGWGYGKTAKMHNNQMFEYLVKYQKHPQLEMLLKMDLYHLLPSIRSFRWKEKGPAMLGISKGEIKYLQQGISLSTYKSIRDTVLKYNLEPEKINILVTLLDHQVDVSKRLINYLYEQDIPVTDYIDYLRYMDLLGTPKENKYLYPKNFRAEHQKQIKAFKIQKNQLLDERIKEYAEELEGLTLERHGYIIRPAQSNTELIVEGETLHHCVGRYGNRMANRNTIIMFVRKSEEKDVPLYTLELDGGKVIQFRGNHNNQPPTDARSFVKAWCLKNRFDWRNV